MKFNENLSPTARQRIPEPKSDLFIFRLCILSIFFLLAFTLSPEILAQSTEKQKNIDEKVKKFLETNKNDWSDLNVPYDDGKVLFDLILKNNYKNGLEIGTSTGHSTIWQAWAFSKTGGKMITIEIDERRHKEAVQNLKEVGLLEYVDARLANAHDLVKELPGPFDFVFSDADKDWYLQYFKDIDPKLKKDGCFTAHNVLNGFGGTQKFLDYVQKNANYKTTLDRSSSSGISISYKTSN